MIRTILFEKGVIYYNRIEKIFNWIYATLRVKSGLENAMKSLSVIFIVFVLAGCSNPGYSTRIYIEKAAGATESDIKLIKNYLLKTPYDVVMIKEKGFWRVESYKINLDEKMFEHLDHKYIMFVVEYYYDKQTINGLKTLEKVEVRIGNSWEGKDPILKDRIDKITDYIVNQLSQRFESSKFSVTRRYTGPM